LTRLGPVHHQRDHEIEFRNPLPQNGLVKRIVLTGAPGSGKSTIARTLAEMYPDQLAVVPEAATQYYTLLGKRWNQLDLDNRRAAQRGIYQLQIAQEDRIARDHPEKTLLLDRGTIDGAAYWPDGPDAYWVDLHTTLARELARYDHILVLESAAAIGVYDGDASNPVRFEDADAALENAKLLARLWSTHPHVTQIPAAKNFGHKLAQVESLVLRQR
jgi:predicted ATPase